jgi:hypothetical protein
MARVAWATPATATGQVAAFSGCAHHCKQVRPLGQASRCCGVDVTASDPSRLSPVAHLEAPPTPALTLPPSAVAASAGIAAVGTHPVPELATGPPRYLRLLTLLV